MLVHHIPRIAAHNARPDAAIHFEAQRTTYADFAAGCGFAACAGVGRWRSQSV